MARPVWSGTLTFGLVSLPVRLYTATDSHTIRFRQLQRGTSDRVRNKRVNERTGEEVAPDEIVKGYDAGDEYVLLEPGELAEIAPGRSRALEIEGFVDLGDIEPVYFDRTYYLGPGGDAHRKVYQLLERALEDEGKAGVATFVMRNREYLVALKAEDGLLTLHTLHWADEIRDPRREVDGLGGDPAEVGDRELRTARQLIEALSITWDPERFHDSFQEKVEALVAAKRDGGTVAKAEEAARPTNVVDLVRTLQESVDRAKRSGGRSGARQSASGGARGGGADREDTAGGRTRRASPLDGLSKTELYRLATDAGIRGRSSMTRDELAEALDARGEGRRAAS